MISQGDGIESKAFDERAPPKLIVKAKEAKSLLSMNHLAI